MEDPTLYDTSEVFYNLPSEDTGSSINLVVYIKKKSNGPIDSDGCELLVCLHSSDPSGCSENLCKEVGKLIHERSYGNHKVCIKAMDSIQYEPITAGLESFGIKLMWTENCGFYTKSQSQSLSRAQIDLPEGFQEIELTSHDSYAEIVNDTWKYKSPTSLNMIKLMLKSHKSAAIAIAPQAEAQAEAQAQAQAAIEEEDNRFIDKTRQKPLELPELVGWILSYDDGAIGMLYIKEQFRRQGLAKTVVKLLLRKKLNILEQQQQQQQLQQQQLLHVKGIDYDYCYIVNGNEASENLFKSLGFQRVSDCAWKGFH